MRNYEYLVAVASRGHFGKAAQECCVTQPTLSLGIKELERQMGFDLVNRERRYQGLTPEGEIVVAYAKRMLKLRASLEAALTHYRTKPNAPLVIGTVPSGVELLARFATRLSQLNLSQRFVTETVSTGNIAASVLNGEMDIGITHLDDDTMDLHVLADLHGDQPFLIAPKNMQGDGTAIDVSDIGDLPLCHLAPEYYGAEICKTLTIAPGARVGPRLCADSVRAVVSYLEQNYWYAIVPRGVVDLVNQNGKFSGRLINTKTAAPRLAIVSRPLATYAGKKLEIIEYLRKTAAQNIDDGPQRACANALIAPQRTARFRNRKASAQTLIETVN